MASNISSELFEHFGDVLHGVDADTPGRVRKAVVRSVEAADHLEKSDRAEVALACELADVIDAAVDSGDVERIHRCSCVAMPSLHKILTSLGLNPEGRKNLQLDGEDEEDGW